MGAENKPGSQLRVLCCLQNHLLMECPTSFSPACPSRPMSSAFAFSSYFLRVPMMLPLKSPEAILSHAGAGILWTPFLTWGWGVGGGGQFKAAKSRDCALNLFTCQRDPKVSGPQASHLFQLCPPQPLPPIEARALTIRLPSWSLLLYSDSLPLSLWHLTW